MNFKEFSKLKSMTGPLLVTGHTGFKGTWLSLLLETLEIEFVGYSLPPKEKSLFNTLGRSSAIREDFGDIRDFARLKNFIDQVNPSAVLHMAAQPLVLESYKSPRETFETNVQGSANLLQACLENSNIKTVGVVTTDKVYKNLNLGIRFKEDDPLSGKDPYSASKVGTEATIAAWRQISEISSGPKIFSLRAGNVIGGGDYADNRLIPDLVNCLYSDGELEIRSPNASRPWQHALDPLYGYLLSLECSLFGNSFSAFNFAPIEKSLMVKEVIAIAEETWGKSAHIKYSSTRNQLESEKLDLDPTRAVENLGWKPTWNQIEAIKTSINWWKNILSGEMNADELCELDLSRLANS